MKFLLFLILGLFSLAATAQNNSTGSELLAKPVTAPELTTLASARTDSTTADQEEPATRTTDSLSVNSDEATTIVSGAEESSNDETTVKEDSGESLPGIEAKSINRDQSETNSLATAGAAADKANLMSIDTSSGNEEDDDHASGPKSTSTTATKAPSRLNMTEVDRIYVSSTKDEQEIVRSWQKMNKKLKKGISQLIGSVIPWALNMSQEAKISSNCSGAVLKWVLSMNQLKSWAMRMLDASGKPIAGLLEGSLTMFGNYRECVKIRAPDDDEIEFAGEFKEYFRGKYCIIQAKPWLPQKDRFYNLNAKLKTLQEEGEGGEETAWYEKTVFEELSEWLLAFNYVNMRVDLCVPSLCSREDLQKVVNFMLAGIDMKARVLRCELEPSDGSSQSIIESSSSSQEFASTVGQDSSAAALPLQQQVKSRHGRLLGWLILPVVAISVVVIASALSLAAPRVGSTAENGDEGAISGKPSKLRHTIHSLSLKRSISSHLNVDYDQLADDKPLALYGIRFLLVMWVLFVESAINLKFEYLRELLLLKELIFIWPMQFIINSSLQFDSLILLTAFTMAYKNCLNDSSGNSRGLFKFVLDKYVRLMPSIMVLVALVVLLPLVYRGPVWNDYVLAQSSACQLNGWLNVAFLQNYLPYREICLPQTWLLSVELQLVILMAPIVYFLNKRYSSSSSSSTSNNKLHEHSNTNFNKTNEQAEHADNPSRPFYWACSVPGLTLLGCILFGSLLSFYNVYSNQLPPSWLYTMADPDSKAEYFTTHLMRLWTHVSVFGMGILAGVECRRLTRNKLRAGRATFKTNILSASNAGLGSLNLASNGAGKQQTATARDRSLSTSSLGAADSALSMPLGSDVMNSSTVSINMSSIHQPTNQSRDNIQRDLSESGRSTGAGDDVNMLDNSSSSESRNNNKRSLGSMLANFGACLAVVATMAVIIFSTHDWSLKDLPKPLVAGLYDSLSRFCWSLAMIWILYKVTVPNKERRFSAISRALGHPMMVSLGKLSFLIYLLHPIVHSTVLAIQEQPIYSSWLMLFHILIGNITITVILALLVSLFVEMPCRNLFRRCGKSLLLAHNHGGSSSAMISSNA